MKNKLKKNPKLQISFVLFFVIANFYCYYLEHQRVNFNNLDVPNSEQINVWGVEAINATQMWDQGYTGDGIKIAVLDTGIDFSHLDLRGNIHRGYNSISPNQPPVDDNGHGTLVTGIIAASNNNIGIIGVAPDAEIYPVKVLDKFGDGDIETVIRGIEWCINEKVQVINMSFALLEDNATLKNVIQRALDCGIIVVASGSNSAGGEVGFPASYDGVISVTSVDQNFKIGITSPKGKIDFSAPGINIISTKLNGGYKKVSGTSFATPHITGLIALMLDKKPLMNQSEVLKDLKFFSKNIGKSEVYGNGIVVIKSN